MVIVIDLAVSRSNECYNFVFPSRLLLSWERPGQAQRSLGPFGPGTPKESEKSPQGCPAPGGPRVPKECATESEKNPKTQLRTLFGLFPDSVAHSLGTLGPPGAGHPCGLFSDSFEVPGPKGPRDLCAWPGHSQLLSFFPERQ